MPIPRERTKMLFVTHALLQGFYKRRRSGGCRVSEQLQTITNNGCGFWGSLLSFLISFSYPFRKGILEHDRCHSSSYADYEHFLCKIECYEQKKHLSDPFKTCRKRTVGNRPVTASLRRASSGERGGCPRIFSRCAKSASNRFRISMIVAPGEGNIRIGGV